jgi:hypothetical protein
MRVDFVIGGTQKGETSALDSFLRQRPEICLRFVTAFDTHCDLS